MRFREHDRQEEVYQGAEVLLTEARQRSGASLEHDDNTYRHKVEAL